MMVQISLIYSLTTLFTHVFKIHWQRFMIRTIKEVKQQHQTKLLSTEPNFDIQAIESPRRKVNL